MEQGIGHWKGQFHIMHGAIRVKSPAYTTMCRIIEACALVHKVCKDRNTGLPAEDGAVDPVDQDPTTPAGLCGLSQDGAKKPHPS